MFYDAGRKSVVVVVYAGLCFQKRWILNKFLDCVTRVTKETYSVLHKDRYIEKLLGHLILRNIYIIKYIRTRTRVRECPHIVN